MREKELQNSNSNNDSNLIWVDMEMSGLDPRFNRILEVAVIVTDTKLEIVSEGIVIAIHQDEDHMQTMDSWNTNTHKRTGLTEKVAASQVNEKQAESMIIEYLTPISTPKKSPLCGNSVHQDRRFMRKYMPEFESFFHYRNLDVSTLKELCKRWNPEKLKGFEKKGAHTALADVIESIEELKYYRENFLQT